MSIASKKFCDYIKCLIVSRETVSRNSLIFFEINEFLFITGGLRCYIRTYTKLTTRLDAKIE